MRKKYTILSLTRTAVLVGTCFIIGSPGAASCQKNAKHIKMTHLLVAKDNNRTVDIRQDETVSITLPENATTGYSWTVESYDKELFNELFSEAHYPATTAVGSGGEVGFIFKGKKSGTGDIKLKHWRSWEGDSSVIGRFHIKIHVMP